MFTFSVAHIRIRGKDLLLVPVHESFSGRSHANQLELLAALQRYAGRAGLCGTVVPVWRGELGRLTYFARPSLHRLVELFSWETVVGALNYRLTVGGRKAARVREEEVPAQAAA
jgi:hypothetical protein